MSRKKILAVDDEPSIVRLVTTALEGRGYEVIAAYNGEEAVDKSRSEQPDLIVMDIMMPKMDGRAARKKIAEDPRTKHIPVVFLSAVGDLDSQLDTMEGFQAEYITKPFKPSELGALVDAMLDPARKAEVEKHRLQHQAKLRTMVNIMHREKF